MRHRSGKFVGQDELSSSYDVQSKETYDGEFCLLILVLHLRDSETQ